MSEAVGKSAMRGHRETPRPGVKDDMAWWSLDELNTEAPDHHHDSTVDGLAGTFDASDELPCFHKEYVLVAEIQQWQLQDDPDAVDSIAKIEEIRGSIRRGTRLPAVVLVHTPKGSLFGGADKARYRGTYHLIEGFTDTTRHTGNGSRHSSPGSPTSDAATGLKPTTSRTPTPNDPETPVRPHRPVICAPPPRRPTETASTVELTADG